MLTRRIISSLWVIRGVYAQSVTNDIPANQTLEIVYADGARRIYAPGAQMHPGYMDKAPAILTPSWPSSGGSSMLVMLDLDAPYGETRVSSLHWLVNGVTLSSTPSTSDNLTPLSIPNSNLQVTYNPPAPPIGDVAHTYAFYLIAPVPSSFALPSDLASNRTPFNLGQFLRNAGLGEESIVARNHFRVRNLTGTPTMAFPAPRASETASLLNSPMIPGATGTREAFEGKGGKVGVRWEVLGGLVGLMAIA